MLVLSPKTPWLILLLSMSVSASRTLRQRSPEPNAIHFHKLRDEVKTNSKRQTTGLDPLSQTTAKTSWASTISVGTPPTSFFVIIDTGSSDLWLEGSTCSGVGCVAPSRFDPTTTSTEVDEGVSFTNVYQDGTTMTAEIYEDVVTLAGLTITNQAFGVANTLSWTMGPGVDGLLGIGVTSNSNIAAKMQQAGKTGGEPLFVNLHDENTAMVNVLGVSVDADGGSICLGCIDGAISKGDIVWAKFTGEFEIAVTAIAVDGVAVPNSAVSAFIDTGSTAIFAGPDDLGLVYNSITGAVSDTTAGFIDYPCSANPEVAFQISGQWFNVSSDLFGSLSSGGGATCVGGVVPSDLPAATWILGDIFLQSVYTIFDFGNSQVGFAQL